MLQCKHMRYLRLIIFSGIMAAACVLFTPFATISHATIITEFVKPSKIECGFGSVQMGDKDSGFYCVETSSYNGTISYHPTSVSITCPTGASLKNGTSTKVGSIEAQTKVCIKERPLNTNDCIKNHGNGYIAVNGECALEENVYNSVNNSSIVQSIGSNFESMLRQNSGWIRFYAQQRAQRGPLGTIDENTAFRRWYIGIMSSCIRESSSTTEIDLQAGKNYGNKFTECLERNGVDLANSQRSSIAAIINRNKGVDVAADNQSIESNFVETNVSNQSDQESEGAPGCNIESMGWLICPTMTVVAGISDSALSAITSFLTIKPSILNMDSKTHEAWSYFRNIANVLFAVMFMWVIFSQVSNVGISNYGIKKMLPKLIIGAILVNASFIICQGAVDLSNVLGNALSDFFDKIAGSVQSTEAAGVGDSFMAVILGGLALTGALALAFLAISVPTLLAVLLVLISVVVILIGRQAIVILLIAISPVAFVAWLLPNTEGLFKKWLGLLKGMLVVFPIISLLYGAGRLASAVLNNAAGDAGTVEAFGMQIAALGASVIPLGATPLVLRSSLNSLGAIGGKLGGLTGMANKNLMGAVSGKSRLGDFGRKIKSGSAQRQANRRAGVSPFGEKLSGSKYGIVRGFGGVASSFANASARLDTSPFGRALGLDKGVYAAQDAVDKAADEAALRELTYKYNGDAVLALENSGNSHVQKMAVKQLAEKGEWGAIQMAEYLRSGHAITSVGMAEAMSGMKGYHAGVGAAGTEALKSLQANPEAPVSFNPGQLDKMATKVLAGMSAGDVSRQSADAIKSVDTLKNSSTASPDDLANIQKVQESAAVVLGSDRLLENTKKETRDALSKL